jgi:hypothetical protein
MEWLRLGGNPGRVDVRLADYGAAPMQLSQTLLHGDRTGTKEH